MLIQKDNIKIDLRETVYGNTKAIDIIQHLILYQNWLCVWY